jgi:hypothetical protein
MLLIEEPILPRGHPVGLLAQALHLSVDERGQIMVMMMMMMMMVVVMIMMMMIMITRRL